MVKISIIVPAYNVEKYICRCLDSIIAQTYEDIETIIVDDGSDGSTSSICDEYCHKYHQMYCVHKKNEGLGFARNTGLEVSTGDFVTFLDGDDYIANTHIENMVKCLQTHQADTCFAGHTKIYKDKTVEFPHVCRGKVYSYPNVLTEILPRMCGSKPDGSDYIEMSVCMVLLSNKIIKENNLRFHSEREFISEDLIFDTDYYPHAQKVCVCDDVGYFYCDNEDSLTTSYKRERFEMQKRMTNEIIKRTDKLGILGKCKDRIDTTFIGLARYCIKLEQKFFRQNGKKEAKRNIEAICNDEMIKQIFNTYPNGKVKLKSRLVNNLIQRKWTTALWYVTSFKNRFGV